MPARSGGRFEMQKNGKLKQVEAPTKSHPQGDAPRDANGNRLDRPIKPQPQTEKKGE